MSGVEHLASFSPGASLISISQYLRFSESCRGGGQIKQLTTFAGPVTCASLPLTQDALQHCIHDEPLCTFTADCQP